MPRGLKRCKCGDFDVFGWGGTRRADDEGGHRSGFETLTGYKVSAVNAPMAVTRGRFAAGEITTFDPSWTLGLKNTDDAPDHPTPSTVFRIVNVMGARVTCDTNGHNYVTYCLGHSANNLAEADLGYGDGNDAGMSTVVVQDLTTGDTITHDLPWLARLAYPSARWADYVPWGGLIIGGGGGSSFETRHVGFSRDTIVFVGNQRAGVDGLGVVTRYKYSTGRWAAGFGESAATPQEGFYIVLPAQMADGGNAWVLAKDYNTLAMKTGIWTNELCYNDDNVPGIGVDPFIPSLPAMLTPAEVVNTISLAGIQTFLGSNPEDQLTNWRQIAYPRRAGYDYILVEAFTILGGGGRFYWDGRRGVWSRAVVGTVDEFGETDSRCTNLYAFENGEVVLAGCRAVKYINANGTTRYNWDAPGSSTQFSDTDGPALSGNDDWIQVKNIALVENNSPAPTDTTTAYPVETAVYSASTADIDLGPPSRKWVRHSTLAEPGISLSRRLQDGNPVCVIHRALEHGIWEYDTGTPIPYDVDTAPYTMNMYAISALLDANWYDEPFEPTDIPQDHRQVARLGANPSGGSGGVRNGGMCFDAVPSCKCGCDVPWGIAY